MHNGRVKRDSTNGSNRKKRRDSIVTKIYTVNDIFVVHEKYGDMIEKWKENYAFVNCTYAGRMVRPTGYTINKPMKIATDHIVAMIDLGE